MKKVYNIPKVEVFKFDVEVQMQMTLSNNGQGNTPDSTELDNIFDLENSGWE